MVQDDGGVKMKNGSRRRWSKYEEWLKRMVVGGGVKMKNSYRIRLRRTKN